MKATITGVFCGVCAIICLIISVTQLCGMGKPLNNSWLFASTEERKAMDKKPLFRQTGIVFALLAAVFLFIGLDALLERGWLALAATGTAIAACVYAVASSLRQGRCAVALAAGFICTNIRFFDIMSKEISANDSTKERSA